MSNVPTNLIPTTVTGLPEYTGSSTLGYLPYVVEGRTYKVQFSNIAAVGAVPSSRTIATGTGLTGGGDLSANRTIAIANGGVGTAQLAASGVSAGVYGSGTLVPVLTVDATGRVTSATTAAVSVSGFVPTSRSVIAGTGLTGGGALTSDVTLNVNFSSSTPQALGTATAGVSTAAARGDHVHPAVDLADTSQTQGALPLGRGGTGDALSPVAGAVVYSTGTRFALSPLGLPGQVLMSDGANAPQWATVSGIGTVTSVNVSGGTTGLTFSGGPVTAAGTITMAGTLAVGNGGTGLTSLTANFVPKGNGTAAFSASQIFDNGTNVGIGTSSPTHKLSVTNGDIRVNTSAAEAMLRIRQDTASADFQLRQDASSNFILALGASERMRINSAGNVAIGTTNPIASLTVGALPVAETGSTSYGATVIRGVDYTLSTTRRGILDIEMNSIIAANQGGTLTFTNNAGMFGQGFDYVAVGLKAAKENATNQNQASYLAISTNDGTAVSERMRIASNGNVGIGTSTTPYRLNVTGGGVYADGAGGISYWLDNNRAIRNTAGAGSTTYFDLGTVIFRDGNGASANAQVNVLGGGYFANNVGIGTTTPAARVHTNGGASGINAVFESNTAADTRIEFRNNATRAGYLYWDANEVRLLADPTRAITSYTNGVERMRIDNAGNVGIGTAAPTLLFQVGARGGMTSGGVFQWGSALTGNNRGILSWDTNTAIIGTPQNLIFCANSESTERMRLTSAGALLVGTTTAVGNANAVATTGFNSVTVTVAGSATATVTVPSGCICIISQAGFSGDAAIFAIKSTGGSQGTTVLSQGTAGAYGFGTTTDPNTGTRTDMWISGSNTLSIKDKTTVSRNFYLTFISNGL